jgi:tetratricopeptide (TPR) repeat protein
MYLRFYGWKGNQAAISDVIKPFREDRNVNVDELTYFVTAKAGWLRAEYRVGGDLTLLKRLLASGIPVMIEEAMKLDEDYWPNDDRWAAHYLLLTGYDNTTGRFTGQDSFRGADQHIPYDKLDTAWQPFNRVYILLYRPEQEETVQSILGDNWDRDKNRQNALETAQSETKSQPQNPFALFNQGSNLTYFERYIEATDVYDQARQMGLPQRMLRYQFGPFLAYFHSGQIKDLLALTEYALKITKNAEEAHLWRGWAYYRMSRINDAVTDWQTALQERPGYGDALYAINFASGKR